jgi:5'-nucleotidase
MPLPRTWLSLALLAALLPAPVRAGSVEVVLLQLNDVYEITRPGKKDLGGLTRVGALRKQLRAKNPNTFAILAGDFFSPSALGTAVVDGRRLDGRHMVAVLNALGLDYATFGNHEFDIPRRAFLERLKESRFTWFSGNITDSAGKPFPGVAPYKLLTVKGADGSVLRLGLLGLTVETGKGKKGNYWRYHDYLSVARRQMAELKGKTDVVVAVTHLNMAEDIRLAREVRGIDLILGGHEHENNTWRSRTPGTASIFKADANVRTVWVHHLRYDTKHGLEIESQLLAMSNLIPEDRDTARVVDGWVARAFAALQKSTKHDPREVVCVTRADLEGRESHVRRMPTNLTELIGRALRRRVKGAELAVYNSGMVRIDDLIPAGPLTYYDVLRILPYGGTVWAADVKGSMLQRLFDKGFSPALYEKGAFLQADGVRRGDRPGRWLIDGKPLDVNKFYRVAINDYLLKGRESKLAFLGERKDEVRPIGKVGELRAAVSAELRREFPVLAPRVP